VDKLPSLSSAIELTACYSPSTQYVKRAANYLFSEARLVKTSFKMVTSTGFETGHVFLNYFSDL
jgi:hypothetical protein